MVINSNYYKDTVRESKECRDMERTLQEKIRQLSVYNEKLNGTVHRCKEKISQLTRMTEIKHYIPVIPISIGTSMVTGQPPDCIETIIPHIAWVIVGGCLILTAVVLFNSERQSIKDLI